jgi:hypothetical protein
VDIRVVKARLENYLTNGTTDDYLRKQIISLVQEMNNEIEVVDKTIDSGMVSTVVSELRQYYFALVDEYGAIPKTTANLVKRANKLDEIIITLNKIVNFTSWAITKNASSNDPNVQRICSVIKPEMESYRKELYNWGQLLTNIITDKKIYLAKVKDD